MVIETASFGFEPDIPFRVVWQPAYLAGTSELRVALLEHNPFVPGGEYSFWVTESRTVAGQPVAAGVWSFRVELLRHTLPLILRDH